MLAPSLEHINTHTQTHESERESGVISYLYGGATPFCSLLKSLLHTPLYYSFHFYHFSLYLFPQEESVSKRASFSWSIHHLPLNEKVANLKSHVYYIVTHKYLFTFSLSLYWHWHCVWLHRYVAHKHLCVCCLWMGMCVMCIHIKWEQRIECNSDMQNKRIRVNMWAAANAAAAATTLPAFEWYHLILEADWTAQK